MTRSERYLIDNLRFLAERFQKLVEQQQAAGKLDADWADPALDTAIAVCNHALGEGPRRELLGNFTAICYFRTPEDLQEFQAVVQLAKPDMVALATPKITKVSR